jgi:hypothetical protein
MMRRLLALPVLLLALAACGNDGARREAGTSASASASSQQAEARVGDVVVHASAVQATALDEAFLRRNGLERSDRNVILVVSVRRVDGSDATGLPVAVTAQAAPEGSPLQPVTLRDVDVDGLRDRIGAVAIAPPDAMRFEVAIRYAGSTSTMQFSRTFFPR